MNGIDVGASSRVWTDGSRLAPVAKYRMEPIPRARTVSTRDPRGCVGWEAGQLTVTSQVSKIMELLIRDAIVSHLEQFKLLCASQHGFRSGKSCLNNLLTFLDEVTRSVEEGHSVDVIYLDFAEVFDKVPHQTFGETTIMRTFV